MLADALADHDEALLAAFVQDETAVSYQRLRTGLVTAARQGLVHPVYFGSAMTGAGVAALTNGIRDFLPRAAGAADGPVAGTVFKVERGEAGEKIAYVRMFSGTIRARERVRFSSAGTSKVTAIGVFDRGPAAAREHVAAGQIATLRGLDGVRVGDWLGAEDAGMTSQQGRLFAPPTLETVVVPCRPADKGALRAALGLLAEQDPLINVRQEDIRQEIVVSLYGEVQKEVIQATLADDFGVDVGFRESTTLCIERPSGTGAAAEFMTDEANPFRATAGLRIDPAAAGSGVGFRLGIESGALPAAFRKAIEETVRQTLREGLRGWLVTDCTVTLTHSGYTPPPPSGWSRWSTSAADFRSLTPLVLMTALLRAGTRVYEPVHRFTLDIPAETLALVLPMLARLGAAPGTPQLRGSSCLVEGDIPAVRVRHFQQQLASLTRGEGILDTALDRYQPVHGQIPVRPRSDHNPVNRKEYLLYVKRRAAGSASATRHDGGSAGRVKTRVVQGDTALRRADRILPRPAQRAGCAGGRTRRRGTRVAEQRQDTSPRQDGYVIVMSRHGPVQPHYRPREQRGRPPGRGHCDACPVQCGGTDTPRELKRRRQDMTTTTMTEPTGAALVQPGGASNRCSPALHAPQDVYYRYAWPPAR